MIRTLDRDHEVPESGQREVPEGRAKVRIVQELGVRELLLPAVVNEALLANDRAKYLMTLVQMARDHLLHPGGPASDLRDERLACGISDVELDRVVEGSRQDSDGHLVIPEGRKIHDMLLNEVRTMILPLTTAAEAPAGEGKTLELGYQHRLEKLEASLRIGPDGRVTDEYVDRLTSAQRSRGDSLHLLVMDLHKELNRLQRQLATQAIDGAQVYGILDEDRPLVMAFMAGVAETRGLKFDHPGLGTTVTRCGDRLVIQNDIGMTDAHVVVIHVSGLRVTLTYTDVHLERLMFFQNLFEQFHVEWRDTVSKRSVELDESLYHLCIGTYQAGTAADLKSYLQFLGSRLVFLIDWNKARKRLRKFAPKKVGLEVLRWAADRNVGHCGFLVLGGEQLLIDALQSAGRLPLPPGGQLCDLLGPERMSEYLKFALQTASVGLQSGQSEYLIRDQLAAELRHYIDTLHQGWLEAAAGHASLIVELATAVRDVILDAQDLWDLGRVQRTVARAQRWEHRADEFVARCRLACGRGDAPRPVLELLLSADDGADALEEAIFNMSLMLQTGIEGAFQPLHQLSALVVEGAQEYLKAVENARQLARTSSREQIGDFLGAVDRTLTVEHQTDNARRSAQAELLQFSGDYKQWYLVVSVADKLEEATDSLLRSGLVLRDYILSEVLRS